MSAFSLSAEPIQVSAVVKGLREPSAGALVTFEGWVRCHNDGRNVVALHYEAYEAMALREGRAIVESAVRRHPLLTAVCVHRVGRLRVGDLAVWIGVTGRHREGCFQACSEIIDAIKSRVPIWKKEFYRDGDSGWVNCSHHHSLQQ